MDRGAVIAGTPVAVDRFDWRFSPHGKLRFLTHAHSDHLGGLSDNWVDRPSPSRSTTQPTRRLGRWRRRAA